MVAADLDLDGVAQRRVADHFHMLTGRDTHFFNALAVVAFHKEIADMTLLANRHFTQRNRFIIFQHIQSLITITPAISAPFPLVKGNGEARLAKFLKNLARRLPRSRSNALYPCRAPT